MRVLLISANAERMNMVAMPLGLGLVAAATRRAGHNVTFLDLLTALESRVAVRDSILSARPQVIGISVRNIDHQCATSPKFLLEPIKSVIDECRAHCRAVVVVGGDGYSIFPTEVLAYLGADFGVWGALVSCFSVGLARRESP